MPVHHMYARGCAINDADSMDILSKTISSDLNNDESADREGFCPKELQNAS